MQAYKLPKHRAVAARNGKTNASQINPFSVNNVTRVTCRGKGYQDTLERNMLKKKLQCDHRLKTFKRKDVFQTHKKLCKRSGPTEEKRQESPKPQFSSCSRCDKTFARKANLNTHILTHTYTVTSEQFTCPECDYKTTAENDLKKHERIHKLDRRLVEHPSAYSLQTTSNKLARIHQAVLVFNHTFSENLKEGTPA